MRARVQGSLVITFRAPTPPSPPTPPPPTSPPSPLSPPPCPNATTVSYNELDWSPPISEQDVTIILDQEQFTLPAIPAAQDCSDEAGPDDLDFTGAHVNVKAALVRLTGLPIGSPVTLSTCDSRDPFGPDSDIAVYIGGVPLQTARHARRHLVALVPRACVRGAAYLDASRV